MRVAIAGALLGVLSRIEETTDGFSLAISTHATWVLAPFLAGLIERRATAGVVLLTAANAGYYAVMGLHGPVLHWVVAGVAAGAVFGAIGRASRTWPPIALVVPAVIAADAFGLFEAVLP